jgi:2-polyprenyl-6-methoxyphenol hydroxylase-like FAD-dependent oxidoreductase
MTTTSTDMAQKPVLISGAGLAALLFARRLLRANIPFQVFERDASLSFRAQGYRLRLSFEGLDAIEDALGPEDWPKFYEKCGKTAGTGFVGFDAVTGEGWLDDDARNYGNGPSAQDATKGPFKVTNEDLASRDGKIVGISRGEMRRFFIDVCESYVQFGKHVTGYESTKDGVRAIFSDGTKSDEGCILVGADGLKSQIAKQVSRGKLKVYDLGNRGIHGQAPTTAFKALGEGVFRIVDETNPRGRVSIITNVRPNDMDDPSLEFGWTMGGAAGVIRAPNDDYTIIGAEAAELAKNLTKNWHPKFKPLFDQMNEKDAAFWKITCSTPEGVPEWENDPRVTVIGDAAHSMTPAGGLGANTAVRDSALLGRLLAEAGGWADDITDKYEKEMRVYGSEAVAQSYGIATTFLKVKIDENSPVI